MTDTIFDNFIAARVQYGHPSVLAEPVLINPYFIAAAEIQRHPVYQSLPEVSVSFRLSPPSPQFSPETRYQTGMPIDHVRDAMRQAGTELVQHGDGRLEVQPRDESNVPGNPVVMLKKHNQGVVLLLADGAQSPLNPIPFDVIKRLQPTNQRCRLIT